MSGSKPAALIPSQGVRHDPHERHRRDDNRGYLLRAERMDRLLERVADVQKWAAAMTAAAEREAQNMGAYGE